MAEEEQTDRVPGRRSRVVPLVLAGVLMAGLAGCKDNDTDRCADQGDSQCSGQDCGFGDGVTGGGGG